VLHLHGLWLNGDPAGLRASLFRVDLSGADLTRVNLSGADLYRADLQGADLQGADLSDVDLCWADLSRANLSRANLSRAGMLNANLAGANLSGANLTGANLSRANLTGGAAVTLLDDDGREYALYYVEGRYIAGCRNFTRAEAVEHWSNPDHQAPESAARLLAAVLAHTEE
jgi:uncharacterized protein YjbI with pentapeptide repeats